MKHTRKNQTLFWLTPVLMIGMLSITSACQPIANPTRAVVAPSLSSGLELKVRCSEVEHLPNDSPEAQRIVEEMIQSFKEQQPAEYMGMARLQRVDRWGEWAVIQGSVGGDAQDIIVVRQTPRGYEFAGRYIISVPLASLEEPENIIPQYFNEMLPEAPAALFTCLEQTWLPGYQVAEPDSRSGFELAYVGTSDGTTEGVTEIHTVQSDGTNPLVILRKPMLMMQLVSSPNGEQIAFWGCPGSLASDCNSDEDLDIWVVNWDGSHLRNLTEDSEQSDGHPDWSPDSQRIVFDSDRSGSLQLYIMDADDGNVQALTNNSLQNSEPKWSPDGKWIAYHCREGFETKICVLSPRGKPAGDPIPGIAPVWSPAGAVGMTHLAFLCPEGSYNDICVAEPDGSSLVRLTKSPVDEHCLAWSPNGEWLAFVSHENDDPDVYKLCVTCLGESSPIRLTDEVRDAGWPSWSPDWNWVAYADVPGNTLMVVRADRSGTSYVASGVFSPPIWRP